MALPWCLYAGAFFTNQLHKIGNKYAGQKTGSCSNGGEIMPLTKDQAYRLGKLLFRIEQRQKDSKGEDPRAANERRDAGAKEVVGAAKGIPDN